MALGKTASVMYPLLNQLLQSTFPKFGMLILDVKGNFYKQVLEYSKTYNRISDVIVIELNSNTRYNPLDKPQLNASVLANRLKTILELFSTNNSESYWLDKAQEILTEAIKLCRLYNNNYVTFTELHNLINYDDYYKSKIENLRFIFQTGKLSHKDIFNLYSSLNFFENEFKNLDSRTTSILKSEISRITNTFISDYEISKVFCPNKKDINFNGFKDVINNKKIVVLNMNIAKYRNLSKIIAAYLKLDFQTEVLSQLSSDKEVLPTIFMCDEYHELVNKLWLRTDDIFTIENAQKQIGKEDKQKISKSISENASETNFNYFTNSLVSKKSNISESISTNIQNDFVYDTKFFTQILEIFSCLAFISTGNDILPPCKLNLIPYFKNYDNDHTDKKSNLKII